LSTKTTEALLADEAPIHEMDELRPLIAEGQEKGLLTFEQIASALEEIEVTKEQVHELHHYLDEHGIDVVGADGKAVQSESGKVEAAAEKRRNPETAAEQPKKPQIDLTVEPSLDSLRLYLRSIGRVNLLTAEQEVSLAKRIEAGVHATERLEADAPLSDEERTSLAAVATDGDIAKKQLTEANLRLVVSIAKRYLRSGLPLLDLVQDGNLGLLRAVDRFQYRRGFKFSTYATWWIRQAITRGIADRGRTIRIPVHLMETPPPGLPCGLRAHG